MLKRIPDSNKYIDPSEIALLDMDIKENNENFNCDIYLILKNGQKIDLLYRTTAKCNKEIIDGYYDFYNKIVELFNT